MPTRVLSLLFAITCVLLAGCPLGETTPLDEDASMPDDASVPDGDDHSVPDGSALEDVADASPLKDANEEDVGPPPTTTCVITKDKDGFFTRSSNKSSYVAYVPASYTGQPMRVIVGLHGCGDSALNWASWGINPYNTRTTQTHIGISIGSRDGQCWSLGTDDDKALAAVDDLAQCFYVNQKKVVLAGFSSGGDLSYKVGLQKASRFAGILIEESSLYGAGNGTTLLAGASWKLNIAHRHHTSDPVYPIAKVKADWVKIKAAGFPLVTSETAGTHDGVSEDWADWLIPQSKNWTSP